MSNNQKRALKKQRLARVAAGHANDTPKVRVVKKDKPTPKQPRREKCGCEKRWNVETKQWEGHIMCHDHASQFARILHRAAENLAKKKETKK